MADPTTKAEEFFPDPNDFMRNAQRHAKVSGACVLEFFACERCTHSFTATHSFVESVGCPNCKHRMRSKVPRLPQEGETTADGFVAAITALRQSHPKPDETMENWLNSQSPAVKCAAMTFGCTMLHRALDSIQEAARVMSGGHR